MRVHLDCIACTLRQALEAARLATADIDVQERIIRRSLETLADYDLYRTPAELGSAVHELVKECSGNPDPYRNVKKATIEMAHAIYSGLKRFVEEQDDRLLVALEVSAVGNLLDAGVYGDLRTVDLEETLKEELSRGFAVCDIDFLRADLLGATKVLIIGDNAGETVLDRILISEIKRACGKEDKVNVFYGVRSAPMINDATAEDAVASGLDHDATIVDTGCCTPGLVLRNATPDFLKLYEEADVVISKGQGNYETLSDSAGRTIHFVLKAKCRAVAEDTEVNIGEYVLLRR